MCSTLERNPNHTKPQVCWTQGVCQKSHTTQKLIVSPKLEDGTTAASEQRPSQLIQTAVRQTTTVSEESDQDSLQCSPRLRSVTPGLWCKRRPSKRVNSQAYMQFMQRGQSSSAGRAHHDEDEDVPNEGCSPNALRLRPPRRKRFQAFVIAKTRCMNFGSARSRWAKSLRH